MARGVAGRRPKVWGLRAADDFRMPYRPTKSKSFSTPTAWLRKPSRRLSRPGFPRFGITSCLPVRTKPLARRTLPRAQSKQHRRFGTNNRVLNLEERAGIALG